MDSVECNNLQKSEFLPDLGIDKCTYVLKKIHSTFNKAFLLIKKYIYFLMIIF